MREGAGSIEGDPRRAFSTTFTLQTLLAFCRPCLSFSEGDNRMKLHLSSQYTDSPGSKEMSCVTGEAMCHLMNFVLHKWKVKVIE